LYPLPKSSRMGITAALELQQPPCSMCSVEVEISGRCGSFMGRKMNCYIFAHNFSAPTVTVVCPQ
jgi:hypothetical protein